MPLFDLIDRTETRAKGYGESTFQYLNMSARPGAAAMREMLERWFERFPESGGADLRARFRSIDNRQHEGAFFELYAHELLRQFGFDVDVHPVGTGTTRPDFLVSQGERRLFYLEATTTQPSAIEAGEQARINQVYDLLDQMESSNFFVGLRVSGAPATPPSARRLREDLSRWLTTLDPDEAGNNTAATGFEGLPSVEWQHEGWSIVFYAFPKSPEHRGTAGARPIGMIMPDAFAVDTDRKIEGAIAKKAGKYGPLDLPFVVAVNVLEEFCDTEHIMDGLLGERTVVFAPGPGPLREGNRRPNGAWYGPMGTRRQNVSAAFIGHNLNPSSIAFSTQEFVHNPWAADSLPENLWQLSQWIPIHPEGRLERRAGLEARVVLGLPDTWPIPD